MKCAKCGETIEKGEEREFNGKLLCEDCYINALSPPRSCDPWAVHSAKSFASKREIDFEITETQARILQVLEETGGSEMSFISEKLQIKQSILEREIATLRHMEKVRGALKDGKKIIRLW